MDIRGLIDAPADGAHTPAPTSTPLPYPSPNARYASPHMSAPQPYTTVRDMSPSYPPRAQDRLLDRSIESLQDMSQEPQTELMEDTPQDGARPPRQPRRSSVNKGSKACKTCLYCRRRKTKCDSKRPSCEACDKMGRQCHYPEDSRRLTRPTVKEYQEIKQEYHEMVRKVAEIDGTPVSLIAPRPTSSHRENGRPTLPDFASTFPSSPYMPAGSELRRTPSGTLAGFRPVTPYDTWGADRPPPLDSARSNSQHASPDRWHDRDRTRATRGSDANEHMSNTISPDSAHAYLAAESSTLSRSVSHGAPTAQMFQSAESETAGSTPQGRLHSYAAYSRQKELAAFDSNRLSSLAAQINLDGLDPEMAMHLFDIFWTDVHLNTLASYRPAIMASLLHRGPYINKILLNAIYFAASVLSDRPQLRRHGRDATDTASRTFCGKIRRTLYDEMDKPSIPTALGLLICGQTLVATNQTTAGWMMSGIAYRMISELDCSSAVYKRSTTSLGQDVDTEVRKRLFYGAYITESLQALYFGRPGPNVLPIDELCEEYHDEYEETEIWTPYVDPTNPTTFELYQKRPNHALLTTSTMLRILLRAQTITQRLYSARTAYSTAEELVDVLRSSEAELVAWHEVLPDHLRFDPEADTTPAPHHMHVLLLYYTVIILLHRPFVPHGTFYEQLTTATATKDFDHAASEATCINAAKLIKNIIEAYKATFSLRNADFLVSYAMYAAIVAILSSSNRSRSRQSLSFFWVALQECRLGSNAASYKPSIILGDMAEFARNHVHEPSSRRSKTFFVRRGGDQATDVLSPELREAITDDLAVIAKSNEMDRLSAGENGFDEHSADQKSTKSDSATSKTMEPGYGAADMSAWPADDPLFGLLAHSTSSI